LVHLSLLATTQAALPSTGPARLGPAKVSPLKRIGLRTGALWNVALGHRERAAALRDQAGLHVESGDDYLRVGDRKQSSGDVAGSVAAYESALRALSRAELPLSPFGKVTLERAADKSAEAKLTLAGIISRNGDEKATQAAFSRAASGFVEKGEIIHDADASRTALLKGAELYRRAGDRVSAIQIFDRVKAMKEGPKKLVSRAVADAAKGAALLRIQTAADLKRSGDAGWRDAYRAAAADFLEAGQHLVPPKWDDRPSALPAAQMYLAAGTTFDRAGDQEGAAGAYRAAAEQLASLASHTNGDRKPRLRTLAARTLEHAGDWLGAARQHDLAGQTYSPVNRDLKVEEYRAAEQAYRKAGRADEADQMRERADKVSTWEARMLKIEGGAPRQPPAANQGGGYRVVERPRQEGFGETALKALGTYEAAKVGVHLVEDVLHAL
jgi:hypothetical protein